MRPNNWLTGTPTVVARNSLNQALTGSSLGPFTLAVGQYYELASYRAWGNGGPGITDSVVQSFTAEPPPPPPQGVRASGTNTSQNEVKYQWRDQNGNLLHEQIVAPGASYDVAFDVPGNVTQVQQTALVKAQFQDDIWVVDDDWNPDSAAPVGNPITPTQTENPASLPPTQQPSPTGIPTAAPPSATTAGTGVWTQTSGTVDTERLDKNTYRQGVDKITAAIDKLGKGTQNVNVTGTVGGGTGTGEIDLSGVEERLDTLIEQRDENISLAEEAQTEPDRVPGKIGADALQTATGWAEQARDQGQSAAGLFGTPGTTTDAGSAPSGSIDLKANASTTIKIPKNPFAADGPWGNLITLAAAFFRRLIAWGIVIAYMIWCFGEVRRCTDAFAAATPWAKSASDAINSIKIAGTGGWLGYPARLIILAIILPLTLTMPMAILAAVSSGLPWSDLVAVNTQGPVGSGLSASIAIADHVVPWVMLLSAPVWYFITQSVLLPSAMFWNWFKMFLPI